MKVQCPHCLKENRVYGLYWKAGKVFPDVVALYCGYCSRKFTPPEPSSVSFPAVCLNGCPRRSA